MMALLPIYLPHAQNRTLAVYGLAAVGDYELVRKEFREVEVEEAR
jgi:hypothetical protein